MTKEQLNKILIKQLTTENPLHKSIEPLVYAMSLKEKKEKKDINKWKQSIESRIANFI